MTLDNENKIIYYCDECLSKVYSETEIEELKAQTLIPYFHDN